MRNLKGKKLLTAVGSICLGLVIVMSALMGACAQPAPAPPPEEVVPTPKPEPIELKGVTVFSTMMSGVRYLGIFAERVTERSNGELIVKLAGGPEVIGPFDLGPAVKSGAIDIGLVAVPFYDALLPEGAAWFLSEYLPAEERERGFYDFEVERHKQLMNSYYLGRGETAASWVIALNKKVEKPEDLAGLKIDASPGGMMAFVEALGATPMVIPHPDKFSSLERGVIDGLLTPYGNIRDMGWTEVLDYVIDHILFESGGIALLVNLDVWNRLPSHLQDLMNEVMIEIEDEMVDYFTEESKENRLVVLEAGVTPITFSAEAAKQYKELSYEIAWEALEEKLSAEPEVYAKLRGMLKK